MVLIFVDDGETFGLLYSLKLEPHIAATATKFRRTLQHSKPSKSA